MIAELAERGLDDVVLFGGGIVPEADIAALQKAGVAGIFTPGAPMAIDHRLAGRRARRTRTRNRLALARRSRPARAALAGPAPTADRPTAPAQRHPELLGDVVGVCAVNTAQMVWVGDRLSPLPGPVTSLSARGSLRVPRQAVLRPLRHPGVRTARRSTRSTRRSPRPTRSATRSW